MSESRFLDALGGDYDSGRAQHDVVEHTPVAAMAVGYLAGGPATPMVSIIGSR